MNRIVLITSLLLTIASSARAQNEIMNAGFTITFVDSQEQGYEARLAIDNDPATMWTTAWIASHPPFPHEIVIQMGGASYLMYGLGYLARQDGIPNGNLKDFEISLSQDGMNFTVISKGSFVNTMDLQMNVFPVPTYAKYIKLKGLNSVPESQPQDQNAMVAAEIKLYKYNGITDKVKPGEPFLVQAFHDGSCTVGYRFYANDVVVSTAPVSSLMNGMIQLPGMLKAVGYYQLKISAYTMDMCGITADEKFSESIILSVEQSLTAPGIPSIIKGSNAPVPIAPTPIPPAAAPLKGSEPTPNIQPKPRVFTVPPKK